MGYADAPCQKMPNTTAATNPKDMQAANMFSVILSSIDVSFLEMFQAFCPAAEHPGMHRPERNLLRPRSNAKQKRFCGAA